MSHQVSRLKNGMTVATVEMPHMASVSLGIWVGIGGRYESAELSGISHFIEHLLFKGTKRRTAAQISQAVEGIGGYLNAWTAEENTCFYSKARHDCFDELLDVLVDMVVNSKFDSVEINKERDVVKEEIAMYRDQPQQYVQELLNEALWPNQPLGRTLTGTEKTLDAITRTVLLNFMRVNYNASGTLVTAAGNLDHRRVVKSVKAFASRFLPGKRAVYKPAENGQTKPGLRLHSKKTEQTQLALGIRTISRHDRRRYSLRILNTVLGENMSSRLFQTVREENGLAYSIYSGPSFFDDTGDLVVSAGLDTDNIEKTLKLVMRELKRLVEQPVPAAELRRAHDYAIGQLDLSLENTEPQMMWIGEHLLSYGKIYSPAQVKKKLSEVTAAEIRAVAREFFRPERMNLALVSPLKNADRFKKLLRV